MLDLLYMTIGITVLGSIAGQEKRKSLKYGKNSVSTIIYIVLICGIAVWLILFSGLRTKYNDTTTYLYSFALSSSDLDFSIKNLLTVQYYGFDFWQRMIKHFLEKSQWLLMVNAIVTNIVYIRYFSKYSHTLGMTMLCYVTIGTYILSMAAQKQLLAMTISLVAIEFLLKKKYALFLILIVIAYTFHPYILTMVILPLIADEVWSKKIIIISVIAAICSFFFVQFIAVFLNMMESTGIGKNYSVAEITDHTIDPLRVVVDAIPIFISWILRDEINRKATPLIKLGINMMVIAWLMTFASLFGNPIYLYRTGQYFASYIPVVVPWMLVYCLPETKYKKVIVIGYMICYAVIFLYGICGFNFQYDRFAHTTLSSLFK